MKLPDFVYDNCVLIVIRLMTLLWLIRLTKNVFFVVFSLSYFFACSDWD